MWIKTGKFSVFIIAVTAFFLSQSDKTYAQEEKEHKPSIAEMAKEGLITKDQQRILEARQAKESGIQTSLEHVPSEKELNAGQIALQLQTQDKSPDMVCLKNTGMLRVAVVDENIPPFVYTNKKGDLDGIDVSIANAIAKELGLKVEFVKAPNYESVVDLVVSKKVNMAISKLSVTFKRSEKVRYAGSYVQLSKALLVNRMAMKKLNAKNNYTVQEMFGLPEASIGVLANSSYVNYAATTFPKAKVVTYDRWEDALDALKTGKILAAFRDEWEIRKAVQKNPTLLIFTETIVLKDQEDPIQMIVPWSSPQFGHYLDKFIQLNPKFNYDLPKVAEAFKKYEQENVK
jgi:polar amino acid transport system substrate-binding protein